MQFIQQIPSGGADPGDKLSSPMVVFVIWGQGFSYLLSWHFLLSMGLGGEISKS